MILPFEFQFKDPKLGVRFIITCLLDHYKAHEECDFGFILYDFLDEAHQLNFSPQVKKEAMELCDQNKEKAKSYLMNGYIKNGFDLTIVKTLLTT